MTRARVAVLLAAAVLVSACGLTENDDPQLIARENVPGDLLDPTTTSATTTPPLESQPVSVYFGITRGDTTRLERVERDVPRPVTPTAVLEALFDQTPTNAERRRGLTTLLPEQASVLGVRLLADSTLVIDLAEGTLTAQGPGLRVAFAQIVFTVTNLSSVSRVLFRVEGEPQAALTGDGTEKQEPVSRADYRSLAPN